MKNGRCISFIALLQGSQALLLKITFQSGALHLARTPLLSFPINTTRIFGQIRSDAVLWIICNFQYFFYPCLLPQSIYLVFYPGEALLWSSIPASGGSVKVGYPPILTFNPGVSPADHPLQWPWHLHSSRGATPMRHLHDDAVIARICRHSEKTRHRHGVVEFPGTDEQQNLLLLKVIE